MNDRYDDRILDDRSFAPDQSNADAYETPEIIDYGTLNELTLSGSAPLTDSFMGSGGGS